MDAGAAVMEVVVVDLMEVVMVLARTYEEPLPMVVAGVVVKL